MSVSGIPRTKVTVAFMLVGSIHVKVSTDIVHRGSKTARRRRRLESRTFQV